MVFDRMSLIGSRFLRICLPLLLLGLQAGGPARAVEVEDLYVVTEPVQTRDRPERQEAFKAAMSAVLVKMTGDRSAADFPESELLQETASRYVQRFNYLGNAAEGYRLEVHFDGAALERALSERGLPVWGKERPAVLLWLAVQDRGKRYLVGGDSGAAAQRRVDEVAAQRGLPLVFPLLDLEDQSKVSFADVSGGFQETLEAASVRYRPDALVVAQAGPLPGGIWRVRWKMYFGGQSSAWESEDRALEGALAEGVHHMSGVLAQRMATQGFAELASGTVISVSGVLALEDEVRVAKYLAGLAPVVASHPVALQGDRVDYWVRVRGDVRDIERLISLGDVLERQALDAGLGMPAQGPAQAAPPVGTLRFRLIR